MNFIAFHYLTLLVRCQQINEHILDKILSASEMGPIVGHYSPQSFRPCETQLIEYSVHRRRDSKF